MHCAEPVFLVDHVRLRRVTEYGLVLWADVSHCFRIAGLDGLLYVGDGRGLLHERPVASLGLLLLTHEPSDPHGRSRLSREVAQELAVIGRVLLLREARPEAQEPDQLALTYQRHDQLYIRRLHRPERLGVEVELLYLHHTRDVRKVREDRVVRRNLDLRRL